jgi:hypothetical protein
MSEEKRGLKEEFRVTGDALLKKVKELIHEGNIRHIRILKEDGSVLMEFPLCIGVVGTIALPTIAAIGAIAALVTSCTIEVERTGE